MNLDYLKNIMEEIDEEEMQDIEGGGPRTPVWQYPVPIFSGC